MPLRKSLTLRAPALRIQYKPGGFIARVRVTVGNVQRDYIGDTLAIQALRCQAIEHYKMAALLTDIADLAERGRPAVPPEAE